ncbi:MAG: FeoA domain-containing protein, partial [Ruminococcus sp.]|nr:FeoA domain-containing protein [Ruminococcus sp.]
MTLKDLKIGQTAVIDKVGGEGSLRQHFLDMGVIPGAEVSFVKLAPMGDPMQLRIHGFQAYAVARHQQQMETADIFPYWKYVTVGDSRVRAAHAAL